jgi:alpha-mannosidase
MAPGREVVLEQFAHLDWDWQERFPQLAQENVQIYLGVNDAQRYWQAQGGSYPYSVCEISFLRYFADANPDDFKRLREGGNVTVVGGGITSPDNLLTSGECFFRAFLVGLQWMDAQPLDWSRMVWLPDDFGHDSQLPVLLVAMGAAAVAFSRVAGDSQGSRSDVQPQPVAGKILNQPADGVGGLDFWWKASDGSTIFAHWMPCMYWQGAGISGPASIDDYFRQNVIGSPSRYVHVPVGADQMSPKSQVPGWAAEWKNPENAADKAVVNSFAYYVERVKEEVLAERATLKTRTFHGDPANPEATTFRSNPYFMGFYASRMELKTLHHETTRLLVQAEVLDAACTAAGGADAGATGRLLSAWNNLAPSTHHDYITGTSVDDVYLNEQLVLSRQVLADAQALRSDLAETIVTRLAAAGGDYVAFNTLGFARAGVVRVTDNDLTWAEAPAMGWSVTPRRRPPVEVGFGTFDENTVQMYNGIVSVTIDRAANWGISSFSRSDSPDSILSGNGNTLRFWIDGGSIYSFGYECFSPDFSPTDSQQRAIGKPQTARDSLGLSASVTVQLEVTAGGKDYPYTLTYTLDAGAPFVTISITGAAPSGMSVFVDFPFKGGPIATMEHGTPYHWDRKAPATLGTGAYQRVFEPTHDFVSVWNGQGRPLGAIYHGGVPAWAIDGSTLTGCILRNTPTVGCDNYGANGTDSDAHTITFALRIGDGVEHAETGVTLREARAFSNPMFGVRSVDGNGTLPTPYSLASSGENALLTVAKRGSADPDELYLRVYTPANSTGEVDLSVAAPFSEVSGATALERPLSAEEETALDIQSVPGNIHFIAQRAVTTLRLAR